MTEMSTKKIVALVSAAIAGMMLIIVFFMNISIENNTKKHSKKFILNLLRDVILKVMVLL
jgi:hypothetical protein